MKESCHFVSHRPNEEDKYCVLKLLSSAEEEVKKKMLFELLQVFGVVFGGASLVGLLCGFLWWRSRIYIPPHPRNKDNVGRDYDGNFSSPFKKTPKLL